MSLRNCPLCNKKKNSLIYNENSKDNLKFVLCDNCKFVFKNPINKVYKKKFYSNKIYYSAKNLSSLSLKKRFQDIVIEIKKNFKSKDIKLLDFGCGNGNFLNYLKSLGYNNIAGYELYLSKDQKKNIFITNNINKIKKKFDIICLNHVLEHVENPLKTIKQIKPFLSEKGIIIIEVPDNSIYEKFGAKPGNFVDEHFSQFTLSSLDYLSKLCNLQIINSRAIDALAENRDPFIPSIIVCLKKNNDQIKNIAEFKKIFQKKEKLIKKKLNKIQNSKIILFGCGDGMKYIMSLVDKKNIKFLIDNNPKLINTYYEKKRVYGSQIIKSLTKKDFIIISALNVKNIVQIKKQIKNINNDVNIINFSNID